MVSSTFLSDLKTQGVDPEAAPKVLLGAASPLWLMFGGAAMAGATWWWWTNRWREAVNLEALLAIGPQATAPSKTVKAAAPEALKAPQTPRRPHPPGLLDAPAAPPAQVAGKAAKAVAQPTPKATVLPAPEPVAAAERVEAAPEPAVEPVKAAAQRVEDAVDPAAPPAAAVEGVEAIADDLTRLVGVGPKLAAALAARGVTSFAKIAAWDEAELETIDKALDLKGRASRDAWVAQARRLAESHQA